MFWGKFGHSDTGGTHQVCKLALVIAAQQLESVAAVAAADHLRMHRDAHDARPRQHREVLVLKLLTHRPGNEISLRACIGSSTLSEELRNAIFPGARRLLHSKIDNEDI